MVSDRDDGGLVVCQVGDVWYRSGVVGRQQLFKDDVSGQVEIDGSVVRLGAGLVRVIQQSVQRHVLSTVNTSPASTLSAFFQHRLPIQYSTIYID